MSKWISVKDGLPEHQGVGFLVAMQCVRKPEWGYRIDGGAVWFYGGDRSRPVWHGWGKTSGPLENSSWHVTHYMPLPEPPEPGT